MSNKYKINIIIKSLVLCFVLAGCVHNVPLAIDPSKDIDRVIRKMKKIPVKVGIYLSDDLKNYVYKQNKIGITFQMKVGEFLPPISMQMAKSMFEEVIIVNSLPPYNNGYKPDVEAVVVPDILYCYGNAIGTLFGHIEAKIILRVAAYDLGGKVLWQTNAIGESESKEVNFARVFLGGMEEVGKTGYQAGFSAVVKIIDDFTSRPPKELYSLIEIKNLGRLRNTRNISHFEIFKTYYQKGLFQFDQKNFYQALYSFEKGEQINPNDLSNMFYIGVCYAYTGSKNKAIDKFKKVIGLKPKSQEASDSKKWIDLLKEPLKIGIITSFNLKSFSINEILIDEVLKKSQMFELIPTDKSKMAKGFSQFVDRCSQQGIRIILIQNIEENTQNSMVNQRNKGDSAREYNIVLTTKVYSTKRKEFKTEIKINERTCIIREISGIEELEIKHQLTKNAAEKLVLRLLENDIF